MRFRIVKEEDHDREGVPDPIYYVEEEDETSIKKDEWRRYYALGHFTTVEEADKTINREIKSRKAFLNKTVVKVIEA